MMFASVNINFDWFRPLQRLGCGLFLCGISFCLTGGLQIAIEVIKHLLTKINQLKSLRIRSDDISLISKKKSL